ncbi:MAG: hypothetical protein JSU95_03585 [Betaproteobacteria bacterium]|nr:MAG: hypothetical protein JSU95_03585 [Betaproteobacteria bacterium]
MTQWTGEFDNHTPLYADLDELLGTQQLWQRDNKLNELYERYGRDAVDALCRRRPDLDLRDIAELLKVLTPVTSDR